MLWPSTIAKHRSLILAALLVLVTATVTTLVVRPRTVKEKRTVAVTTKDSTVTAAVKKQEASSAVTSVTGSGSGYSRKDSARSGTAHRVIKVTEHDPTTGNVIRVTETTEDTGSSDHTTTDTGSSSQMQTSTATQAAATTDSTSTTTTTESSSAVTVETEKPVEQKASRLGVGMTSELRPMVTYTVKKVGPVSLAAALEVDLAKMRPSGAGVAGLVDLDRDGSKYVGVYGEYKFKEKKAEVGITAGVRF